MGDSGVINKRTVKVLELETVRRSGNRGGSEGGQKSQSGLVAASPEVPGYKLLQKIFEVGASRGKQMREMADEMGISLSTLSHLRTGRRLATQLEREIIMRMAEWLELPPLAVMMLAEQVTLKHFYSQTDELTEDIERALSFIRKDSEWGGLMPRQVDAWDAEAKLWVIWCYERATQTKLIGGGVDYIDLLEQLEEFRSEHPMRED